MSDELRRPTAPRVHRGHSFGRAGQPGGIMLAGSARKPSTRTVGQKDALLYDPVTGRRLR